MKTKQITQYICETCKEIYDTPEKAMLCESRSVSQEKGVKIGDIVIITAGEGIGKEALVTSIDICSREYGHYAWERYWHTVAVTADLLDGWGSRYLLFDNYETK